MRVIDLQNACTLCRAKTRARYGLLKTQNCLYPELPLSDSILKLCPNIFRISRDFFERERARHYNFSIHTPSLSIFGYAGARLRTYFMVDQCGVGLCDEI